MRPTLVLALVLAASLSGCLVGPLTGKPVPPFQLVTSEGQLVNESTYLGRYLILDLMATWCGPCKLEVAHLREVQARHPDTVILSIGVDPQETMAEHEAFRAKYGASWPYAIDREGKVSSDMRMRIIPKLIVVDPQGIVVFEREGEVLPAAITRTIDPGSAPPAGATWLAALAALVAGLFAPLNPYRRTHRETATAGPTLAALGVLAALALVAWPIAGLASTRATLGSLFIGALTLGAVGWWFVRVRRRVASPTLPPPSSPAPVASEEGVEGKKEGGRGAPATAFQAASDRAYEMAPHFAAAVVLALGGAGLAGFFAPFAAFFAGAAGGFYARARLPEREREGAGIVGLALVGAGLVLFGARIFFV